MVIVVVAESASATSDQKRKRRKMSQAKQAREYDARKKRIPKRRSLTEEFVNGNFTEDRITGKNELKDTEEVYVDPEKTIEALENMRMKYKTDWDRHFTECGDM